MMEPAFIPANGAIEAAISIAVLVIAFIGWLVQIVGQAKGSQPTAPSERPPGGQRPVRPAPQASRPRDERLQSEIDSFLREVSAGRKGRPANEDEAVEVLVEEEEERTPRRLINQQDRFASPTENTVAPIFQEAKVANLSESERDEQKRRERLLSNLRERHLESSPLGSALQKHIEQTLSEADALRDEKKRVERQLAEATAELSSIREQRGQQSQATTTASQARLAALLRDRRTVKDAIVINEVLGRPKGLRQNR